MCVLQELAREADMLRSVQHDYIIRLLDIFQDDERYCGAYVDILLRIYCTRHSLPGMLTATLLTDDVDA